MGHLRGILGHLGASWDQELPRHLPDGFARGPGSPSWPILDPILGPKIGYILVIFGVIFWTSFVTLLEQCYTEGGSVGQDKCYTRRDI